MEGIGNSLGVEGSQKPKNLSKCMKLDSSFQRGGGCKEKCLSVGEVWIILFLEPHIDRYYANVKTIDQNKTY